MTKTLRTKSTSMLSIAGALHRPHVIRLSRMISVLHAGSFRPLMDAFLDTIIIGAGAAGIGASAVLRAAGLQSYVLLEASNRTGGRVNAFELGGGGAVGSSYSKRVILENGANWVSGAGPQDGSPWPHSAVNPLFHLALRHNLSMVRVPGSATNMSNWNVSSENGSWVDIDGARRNDVNAVRQCVALMGRSASANLTAAAAAAACGWKSRDGVDRALLWQLFTGETGLPPQLMSAMGYLPDPTYEDFGPDDFFVADQHPRGFARLLDEVANGALDGGQQSLDTKHLITNATVAHVKYNCEAVTVQTVDGRSFRARHLISTLPLGVLQRRADDIFDPRLSRPQMRALQAIPMGNYTKIFAQWVTPFWDTSVYKWAQGNEGFNGGELGSVRNLAHPSVLPGSNALLFDLGDPQASEWEGLSDKEASARLVRRLRDTHPGAVIPPPIAFHITRHSRDPLSYGAYSAWGQTTVDDHHAAAKPLSAASMSGPSTDAVSGSDTHSCPPRVWLSGEAFCPNYNGFVHGGLLSGRRDARKVLEALGRPTSSLSKLPGEEAEMGCDRPTARTKSNNRAPRSSSTSFATVHG